MCIFTRRDTYMKVDIAIFARWKYFLPKKKKKAEKKSSTCRNIRIPNLEKRANIVIDVIVCTLFVRKGTVSFIFQLISSIWTIFFLESFRRFNQMFQLSNVVLCKFVPYYNRYNFVGWKLVSVCLTLHVYLKMRKKIDMCIVHYRTMFKKTQGIILYCRCRFLVFKDIFFKFQFHGMRSW